MVPSDGMKHSYPKLAAWIETNIPKTIEKPKVFAAFMKYSETDQVRAKAALNIGPYPIVSFRDMPNANGQFIGSTFPVHVFLSIDICNKFETSATDRADPRMHKLLESTILHEMVHWGDWQDGVDQPSEEGKDFETEAYGADVHRYW